MNRALLTIACCLSAASALPQTPPLATYTMLGRDIACPLPADQPFAWGNTAERSGWTLHFGTDGKVVGAHLGKGFWDQAALLHAKHGTQKEQIAWRAKFVIFETANILDHGA